jgi:hypothetical protein
MARPDSSRFSLTTPSSHMLRCFWSAHIFKTAAIIDSMVANETMVGRDGTTVIALPHDRLQELLKQHGRLEEV